MPPDLIDNLRAHEYVAIDLTGNTDTFDTRTTALEFAAEVNMQFNGDDATDWWPVMFVEEPLGLLVCVPELTDEDLDTLTRSFDTMKVTPADEGTAQSMLDDLLDDSIGTLLDWWDDVLVGMESDGSTCDRGDHCTHSYCSDIFDLESRLFRARRFFDTFDTRGDF